MSRNNITSIGPRSFDSIAQSLHVLNLRENLLKRHQSDIFSSLFSRAGETLLQITLRDNSWHCDCNLLPLKNSLLQHATSFTGVTRCGTPFNRRNYPIHQLALCDGNTTSPDSTDWPPTTTRAPTTDPKPPTVELKCLKNLVQNVSVGSHGKTIRIHRTMDGKFAVAVKDFPEDYAVLWYEQLADERQNAGPMPQSVKCFLNRDQNQTRNVNLGDSWQPNKVHTFCVKPKSSPTMTPLDCVSFNTVSRTDQATKIWISKRYRIVAIVLLVGACVTSVLFGVGIVFCLAWKYLALFDSYAGKESVTSICDQNDDLVSRRSSGQSNRIAQLYLTQSGSIDGSGIRESEFGYIVCERSSLPSQPSAVSFKPLQINRFLQASETQDEENIYCELN